MDTNSSIDIIAACVALPHINTRIDALNKESAMMGENVVADKRRREINEQLDPLYRRREEFHRMIFGGSR